MITSYIISIIASQITSHIASNLTSKIRSHIASGIATKITLAIASEMLSLITPHIAVHNPPHIASQNYIRGCLTYPGCSFAHLTTPATGDCKKD